MAGGRRRGGEIEVYPGVDLGSSRWLVALIREVMRTRARGSEPPDPATLPRPTGRDLLLASLGRVAAGVAELGRVCGGDEHPAAVRLTAGAVFAAATADFEATEALLAARRRVLAGGPAPGPSLGRWLGGHLRRAGGTLRALLLPDDHPLLATPYHRALLAIDRRLCDRVAVGIFAGRLDRQRLGEQLARVRSTRLAFIEAVIGLVWSDDRPNRGEIGLVNALVAMSGFDPGERALLRGAMRDGSVTLDQVAADIPHHPDRLRLLATLVLAAWIDGDFSAREQAYIDRVAAAFGLTEADLREVDAHIAEQLARDPRLLDLLAGRGRITRAMKAGQGSIQRLVRKNLGAIRTEILETGDLMALLARSLRQPLAPEEQARMRAQLIDLCKAVPALALFAAPGGSLLLPILARILPFSLAPSGFQEADEGVF